MSEEQRRQATATNKDPLIQYIVHKAREEIMNRNVSGQVDTQQQLQHQHQRLTPNQLQELNASQRGLQYTDVPPAMLVDLATQRSHDNVDTTAATAATRSSQTEPLADIPLHASQQCANCGGLAKQRSTSPVDGVDEQDSESLPFNHCSKNCQREHSISGDGGVAEGSTYAPRYTAPKSPSPSFCSVWRHTFIGRLSRPCRKMHRPLHALAVKDRGRSRRGRGKRCEVREGAIRQGRASHVPS